MNTYNFSRFLTAVGLCVQAAACGFTDAGESEAADTATSLSLSLHADGARRITGTLSDRAASINFAVEQIGETRRVVITTEEGRELISSSLLGRVEDQSILGGRLRLRGDVSSTQPEVTGDLAVLEEFHTIPEYALAVRLLDTLRERGVRPSLVSPAIRTTTESSKAAGNHREWYEIRPFDQRDFATWTFWFPTYVTLHNTSGDWAQATLMCSWSNTVVDLPPGGADGRDVRCGGIRLFVRNTSFPATIWVHVQ
jgi:hypothetical protein